PRAGGSCSRVGHCSPQAQSAPRLRQTQPPRCSAGSISFASSPSAPKYSASDRYCRVPNIVGLNRRADAAAAGNRIFASRAHGSAFYFATLPRTRTLGVRRAVHRAREHAIGIDAQTRSAVLTLRTACAELLLALIEATGQIRLRSLFASTRGARGFCGAKRRAAAFDAYSVRTIRAYGAALGRSTGPTRANSTDAVAERKAGRICLAFETDAIFEKARTVRGAAPKTTHLTRRANGTVASFETRTVEARLCL